MTVVPPEPRLFKPRQLALQVVGFILGVALLGWCISISIKDDAGQWRRLLEDADPGLVAGLALCTVLSLVVNGTVFWLVVLPLRRFKWLDLQFLNFVTGILNYAPIRIGLVARIAYHRRVDRMPWLQIVAWLGAVTVTVALGVGAALLVTVLLPAGGLTWALALTALLAVLIGLTIVIARTPLAARVALGADRLLAEPRIVIAAVILRLFDIAAFVGRMACAAAILGLELRTQDIILLAIAALALSLNPLGRTGFREATVAFVASRMLTDAVSGEAIDSTMATLALLESAGEAIASIPLGAVSLIWYHRRWTRGARDAAD